MVLPEHQQNLPVLGGDIEKLVRDVPWAADGKLNFAGLRVMLGGRSAFFGGWSPQLLDNAKHTEMPRDRWPDAVVTELKDTYLPRSAEQLAVDETNDFIFGPLHEVLRQRLADGIDGGKVDEGGYLPIALLCWEMIAPAYADSRPRLSVISGHRCSSLGRNRQRGLGTIASAEVY